MKTFKDFKFYEICDEVLKFFDSQTALSLPNSKLGQRLKDNVLLPQSNVRLDLKDKAKIDLSKEELEIVLIVLEEDGLIKKESENPAVGPAMHFSEHEGKLRPTIYGDLYFYSITVKGVTKLLEGGYSQKFKEAKRQAEFNRYILIFTVVAAIATFIQALPIINKLFKWLICFFCEILS